MSTANTGGQKGQGDGARASAREPRAIKSWKQQPPDAQQPQTPRNTLNHRHPIHSYHSQCAKLSTRLKWYDALDQAG